MKIYQLHEYSGEWDCFQDIIIGSYLKKERAEEEMEKAKTKEKYLMAHSDKCRLCPFLEKSHFYLDDLLSEYPDYCSEIKLRKSDYGLDCENYYLKFEESTFEIKEIKVEE